MANLQRKVRVTVNEVSLCVTETDRDFLLMRGYELLKQCPNKQIWVFVNKDEEQFAESALCAHVLSDTLTF